jgi:hypothetical protein
MNYRAVITAYNRDGLRHFRADFSPPVPHRRQHYDTTDTLRLAEYIVNLYLELKQHGDTLRTRRVNFTGREKEDAAVLVRHLMKRKSMEVRHRLHSD